MLTTIPFSGFFGTLHDSELDIALEQMFSDPETGCGHNEGLVQHAFSKCDWGQVRSKYAKKYTKALASRFGIDMTFESLQSPREYNFSTDRIFCEISLEEVKRLREATPERLFREEARARFTSGDGFIVLRERPRHSCRGGIARHAKRAPSSHILRLAGYLYTDQV